LVLVRSKLVLELVRSRLALVRKLELVRSKLVLEHKLELVRSKQPCVP
jgi:hypothetical protein